MVDYDKSCCEGTSCLVSTRNAILYSNLACRAVTVALLVRFKPIWQGIQYHVPCHSMVHDTEYLAILLMITWPTCSRWS